MPVEMHPISLGYTERRRKERTKNIFTKLAIAKNYAEKQIQQQSITASEQCEKIAMYSSNGYALLTCELSSRPKDSARAATESKRDRVIEKDKERRDKKATKNGKHKINGI